MNTGVLWCSCRRFYDVTGRRLEIGQCFKTAFVLSTRLKKLTHTNAHTYDRDGEKNSTTSALIADDVRLFPCSLPFISLQTFYFVKKKSTILHVIYHIFRYKTCTGCLEQQQKYNIQFIICHFFSLIIINSIGESSWRLSLWLFGVLSPKWPASHSVGLQGTNKYTGQDVKKKENKKSDYFYYKSRQ